MIEEFDLRALHVEAMQRADLHAEHDRAVLFQASTVGALIEGSYDGHLSIAELAEHGDTGLGTFHALDGELIAVGEKFFRADADGRIEEVEPGRTTPFAIVGWLSDGVELEISSVCTQEEVLGMIDSELPADAPSCLLRIDGAFKQLRLRSIPRQTRPYRPLTEIVAQQREFELTNTEGTLVGFRFPSYAQGIEIPGYHLHYITRDRSRGGHVLDMTLDHGRILIDPSRDLHVGLPAGVDLAAPDLAIDTTEAIARIEH